MLLRMGQQYLTGLSYARYFSDDPVRLTVGRSLSSATIPLQERGRVLLQQAG
jgi:hypothetical protein